jgi:hypothetical protein
MSYANTAYLSRILDAVQWESHMAAWKKWLLSQPAALDEYELSMTFADLREQVQAALAGCDGPMCERMRWRLEACRNANELWMLRGEIFQLVAKQFSQAEAARRINGLLPAFEGWVPARMLVPV